MSSISPPPTPPSPPGLPPEPAEAAPEVVVQPVGPPPEAGAQPRAGAGVVTTLVGTLLIVGVWALVTLWGPLGMAFHTKGEPREGLVVRQILQTGNWVLPRVNESELPAKPPLFHWLGALVALTRGSVDEWSIRFPSAVLSLVGVLAVFATGTALWGARSGTVAALVLMTTFEWTRAATNARVDMALTVGLEVALLAWLFFVRTNSGRWLVPVYLGMAFATLAKGPVGIVLPGTVALASMLVRRDLTPLRRMHLVRGALVVIVLAGAWYALAVHQAGREFLAQHVLRENVFRVLDADTGPGDYQGHRHSAVWLAGVFLLGFLPWTAFFPGVGTRLWQARRTLARDDPVVYLGLWSVLVFALYAVAVSKRGVYLLGLYPAVALLVAWQFEEQRRVPVSDRWLLRGLAPAAWALFAIVGALTVVSVMAAVGVPVGAVIQALLPPATPPYGTVVGELLGTGGSVLFGALAVALVGLAVCAQSAWSGNWLRTFSGLVVATVAAIVVANAVVMPAIAARESARNFVTRAAAVVGPDDSVAFYRAFSYPVLYYWPRTIPDYTGSTTNRGPHYLIVSRKDWAAGDPALRHGYEPVVWPDDTSLGEAYDLMLLRRVATG